MVGADSRIDIFPDVVASNHGRVAVHGLAIASSRLQFLHDLGILRQHARIVHHLREVVDVVARHQLVDGLCIQRTSRRLERCGRHTAGGAEVELEMHSLPASDHVIDTLHTQHIGDFVRVAHRGHRAMAYRLTGKLRGR